MRERTRRRRWRRERAPAELHRLDVEAERGADRRDVLAVEPLDDGRLARVVEAAVEGRRARRERWERAQIGPKRAGKRLRGPSRPYAPAPASRRVIEDVSSPMERSHHKQPHLLLLGLDLFDDGQEPPVFRGPASRQERARESGREGSGREERRAHAARERRAGGHAEVERDAPHIAPTRSPLRPPLPLPLRVGLSE